MKKKANNAERDRNAKIQRLIHDRRLARPQESYEEAFSAIANSPEGREIFANMHFANEDAVPVQNPRIVKLLLGNDPWRYPLDESEYRRRYLQKFGPVSGYGAKLTAYATEEETRSQTDEAVGRITDEPKLKEEGRQKFLNEVQRLMALGRTHNAAWAEASSTSPGREFYQQWSTGAAQIKSAARN